jgi:hypothetical protein
MERVAGQPIERPVLRVDFGKDRGVFSERKAERGGWTVGSIFPEFEGSFVKKTARLIGRPRKVGDMATLVGLFFFLPKS